MRAGIAHRVGDKVRRKPRGGEGDGGEALPLTSLFTTRNNTSFFAVSERAHFDKKCVLHRLYFFFDFIGINYTVDTFFCFYWN